MNKGFITPVVAFIVGLGLVVVPVVAWYTATPEPVADEPEAQAVGGFDDPFISLQVGSDPDNGDCLTTDGTESTWSATCGSGGGAGATTTINGVSGPDFTFATGTATGIGLTISSSTGTLTFTPTVSSGYNIPLTASTTEWANKISSQWITSGSNIYYNTGNVGIGTSSPENIDGWARVLDVYGAVNSKSIVTTSAIRGGMYAHNSGYFSAPAGMIMGANSNHPVSFITNGATRMTINTSGNVGIGTSTIGARLSMQTTGTTDILNLFETGGVEVFTVLENGRVGIGTTSPSAKLDVVGTASSVVFKAAASGSASDGTGQGLSILTGATGTSGSGTLLQHFSNNGAGTETLRNTIRFYDSGTTFTDDSYAALMTVLNTGNVGIGTASPSASAKLHIDGSNALIYTEPSADDGQWNGLNTLNSSGAVIGGFTANTQSGEVAVGSRNASYFTTIYGGSAERMRITNAGNVGIGTTSPARKLSVESAGTAIISNFRRTDGANAYVTFSDNTTTADTYVGFGAAGNDAFIRAGNAEMLRVTSAGNVGIGTTSPGSRLELGSGQIALPLGSVSAPSYSFSGDLNTGIYSNSSDILSIAAGGVTTGYFTSSQARFRAGSAGAPGISFINDANTGVFGNDADQLSLATAGLERVTITSAGNVGIGTTSPQFQFHVEGVSAGINLIRTNADTAYDPFIRLGDGTVHSQMRIDRSSNGDIYFTTNDSTNERMRITSNGNVGIGTTSPGSKLAIVDDSNNDIILLDGPNGTYGKIGAHSLSNGGIAIDSVTSGDDLRLRTQGSDRLTINSSGNVGIGTTTPAARLQVTGVAGTNPFRVASSSNTSLFEITQLGRVGIGSSSPSHTLTVAGDLNVTGASRISIPRSFTWPGVATTTSATSTIPLGIAMSAEAWNSARCKTTSGTAAWLFKDDAGNRMNGGTASTTSTSTLVTLSTNNTFTTGEGRNVDIGPLTNAIITCSVDVTINN